MLARQSPHKARCAILLGRKSNGSTYLSFSVIS